jgi:hypothetical protein
MLLACQGINLVRIGSRNRDIKIYIYSRGYIDNLGFGS